MCDLVMPDCCATVQRTARVTHVCDDRICRSVDRASRQLRLFEVAA